MKKNKKAQAAIEILIIFGILVIGAVLFGLFYFNNVSARTKGGGQIQNTVSDFENIIGSDVSQTPGIDSPPSIIACTNVGIPIATPNSGTYDTPILVELSYSDDICTDYNIYYTTDNSSPNSDSTRYVSTISIDSDTNLKAIVIAKNSSGQDIPGDISEFEYIIEQNATILVFDTTKTSTGSSGINQIKLPLEETGVYNFNVDWNDGTNSNITSWGDENVTHTYSEPGIYEIKITGEIKGFRFNYSGDKEKLREIKNWGNLNLGNSGNYFSGCSNLNITATDVLDLNGTTNLSGLFHDCTSLVFNESINSWNTSSVTDMSSMFYGASDFNQSLSFDTSNVTNMSSMFGYASDFNQSLSSFDTSSVTDMSWMFSRASSFNQSLSSFDTSSVTDMSWMFYKASDFNQSLSSFDTSSVTNMSNMFSGASSFNLSLDFNTSSVTDMSYMFHAASSFNQSLSSFDTSSVTNMSYMFHAASSFNQPLSFDTSSVTNMSYMFYAASSFNQSLSSFDTSSVTNMSDMFYAAYSFNQSLSSFDTSNVTDMSWMFYGASSFNQPLSFDTSSVTNMSSMFSGASDFNQSLSFDTSSVTNMSGMFSGASDFNQSLSFDTSNVTNMSSMFARASSFNQSLSFDTSNVTDMARMFSGASDFNQSLSFDTSNVTNMSSMFARASSFNQSLSFDTSSVTYMRSMFYDASSFDQNISSWNVDNVTDWTQIFENCPIQTSNKPSRFR